MRAVVGCFNLMSNAKIKTNVPALLPQVPERCLVWSVPLKA